MTAWKCAVFLALFGLLPLGLIQFDAAAASPGQAAYEKANRLLVAQKLPEALVAVDEALRLDPKLVPALTLKAKLAMAAYRLEIARQCLEQALAIDPHAPYAQFLYGMEAYLGNDLKEALPRFQKARQLSPADPRAALYLGLTVESLGQPAEALSLYEEAVRLERAAGGLQAETLLPGARLLLLMDRLPECERWLGEAVKLSPKSRDVHFEMARLLLRKGDAAQAAVEGEAALSLSDGVVTDSSIHYLLIRAYRKGGMPDRAAMHAEIMRIQETPAGSKRKD
jgi:tetratricopeptide (TPR) repeat protein